MVDELDPLHIKQKELRLKELNIPCSTRGALLRAERKMLSLLTLRT